MIGVELVGTCFSSSHSFSNPCVSFSLPLSAAAFTKSSAEKQERVGNTPLSPSHAGDKGIYTHGLRPVDMAVLPRPSSPRKGKEEGKAAVSVPSKQNTNTTAPAAVLSATPAIANTNGTTISSVQTANACSEGDAL